jgi:pentose-5-phosphate-3-epimerase
MPTPAQEFYGNSKRDAYAREDVLAGRVVRLSPALMTIVDGRAQTDPVPQLQQEVQSQVARLLDHRVRSFHVDVNFADYTAFGTDGPAHNEHIFTPEFVDDLNQLIRSQDGFLTLHLLSNFPERHLGSFEAIELGGVCFQLDVIVDGVELATLMQRILDMDAAPSPVIETVGSDRLTPAMPGDVHALLRPVLPQTDVLTFQASATCARPNDVAADFNPTRLALYTSEVKRSYFGTLQFQGGITVETTAQAVEMGADFLICGKELFHHPDGLAPEQVIDLMLEEAARVLGDKAPNVDYQMDE